VHARRALDRVPEQRRLPDSRLADDHERSGTPSPARLEQFVDAGALYITPDHQAGIYSWGLD
jgi:hypothetical protein